MKAQQILQRTINWSKTFKTVQLEPGRIDKVMYCDKGCYNLKQHDRLPYYCEVVNEGNTIVENVAFTDIKYTPLTTDEQVYDFKKVGASATLTYAQSKAGSRNLLTLNIFPFRRNPTSGILEKATSFAVEIKSASVNRATNSLQRTYTHSSVLASGRWYKIGINADGIYKMDQAFFKSLDIDVTKVNPKNIRVYGNGGGMLPEYTLSPRVDDLAENAIYINNPNDSVFSADDYVLFFGKGPHQWVRNGTDSTFNYSVNSYSNLAYYFITTDLGPGKRVSTRAAVTATPNTTVTSFNDYTAHKSELANLGSSGREWFGESFTTASNIDINFNLPDYVSGAPANIVMRGAIQQYSGSSSLVFSYNSKTIFTEQENTTSTDGTSPVAYGDHIGNTNIIPTSASVDINVNFKQLTSDAQAWLGYITINYRRNLRLYLGQTLFRDVRSVGKGKVARFNIDNTTPSVAIWDITTPWNATALSYSQSGSMTSFIMPTDTLRQYVVFDYTSFLSPTAIGSIANQNLHALPQTDFLVVTHPDYLSQAQAIAAIHQEKEKLSTIVVTTDQIYNEFSSGSTDITAIRDFAKMFYDRANGDSLLMPKYLLLFGDGSFDNKSIIYKNTNYIPTYESPEALETDFTYVTDDYFGILADGKGANITDDGVNKIDLAVGRLPAFNTTQATTYVDKIKSYYSSAALGNWRNIFTFVADFDDLTYLDFITPCESFAQQVSTANNNLNIDKIYLYAYSAENTPGGVRFPTANADIKNRIYNGTLIMDYEGHGGFNGWSNARILNLTDISALNNKNKLPLVITASCDISRFDDPTKESPGEVFLDNAGGGAIGMLSTVRLVYFGPNETLNGDALNFAMRKQNGHNPSLGWLTTMGKNYISTQENGRKFVLLGDPALPVAFPVNKVLTTTINGKPVGGKKDTLKALEHVTISGIIADVNGNINTGFNGVIYPTVYDKASVISTLGIVGGDPKKTFSLQKNVIYKGQAYVTNGKFSFTFIVPKDIAVNKGLGRISYYADNNQNIDAANVDDTIIVGGVNDTAHISKTPPKVQVYMNNDQFVRYGITDNAPSIYVKLYADGGINAVGNAVGHDITAIIDNDQRNTLDLNDYYTADPGDYRRGTVLYPLYGLSDGAHSLQIKAFDVYNNAGLGETDFIVASNASMALKHVLNYPNPFTTHTEFMFEHNQPNVNMHVQIQIFSVSGKLVKTIQTNIIPGSSSVLTGQTATSEAGYRVTGINWDGTDDYGSPIGRGTYLYKVSVSTSDGKSAHEFQKLVVLR